MIPYGKDNWRRAADMTRGEWFAARGYTLCRIDVRGTGSSGGVALDEYTADETRDGYDAVEWLASQPWCDGAVAMWGISYGGRCRCAGISHRTARPALADADRARRRWAGRRRSTGVADRRGRHRGVGHRARPRRR
jgi:putative CocE/NonD family hydrolase